MSDAATIDLDAPLVVGFGVTGQAIASVLIARGHRPMIIDDAPSTAAYDRAATMGVDIVAAPSSDWLREVIAAATVLLPSPGVPDHHEAFVIAEEEGLPVCSEFDLAALWDDRPIVAITGTNGKTSVTMLVTAALEASGLRAEAVGNTPVPLVAAIDDPTIDVFVVEASSFRLAHSTNFAPTVATWLNFAPDHLDAHADLETYLAAKASIWAHLPVGATIVANAEDAVVMDAVPPNTDCVTFGLDTGSWHIQKDWLIGPSGPLIAVEEMSRRRPHDLANAACAAATAAAAGASFEGIASALACFAGLPHRVEHVGTWHDVAWFNDSKATVPQATLAAVGGFSSVVLIAGGANKGLDLGALANGVPPVHTVIAIGDAAAEVSAVFEKSSAEVVVATSMAGAVQAAAEAAHAGDTVLLSPACTSFDWYDNYGQRGDDFTALVNERYAS